MGKELHDTFTCKQFCNVEDADQDVPNFIGVVLNSKRN